MSRAALVLNPAKVDDVDDLVRAVRGRSAALGWGEPLVLPTTVEDTGHGMAREAVQAGVDVVLAAGGDGTVRSVITTLCGTGVRLALVPAGTGNLLARNLQLVSGFDETLDVAFSGADRTIDVGLVDLGAGAEEAFAVMAGMGMDAAVMRDAPEGLKKLVGWPAYLVSGAKHLRRSGFDVELRIDGGEPVRRHARSVLVGNVGELQGEFRVLPDARPDDGVLDVAVVAPRRLADWAAIVVGVLRREQHPRDRRLETFRGRRISVRADSVQPRQLDGDPVRAAVELDVVLRAGALVVKVPATP